MVCYRTPKPTSLDILDLLDHNHTNKHSSQATGSSSSSQHTPHDGDEDDECYKSCDDNDHGPLLNGDDDYVD